MVDIYPIAYELITFRNEPKYCQAIEANCEDPDQTAEEQSDQGLRSLLFRQNRSYIAGLQESTDQIEF